MQLELFCKREKNWGEISYVEAFILLYQDRSVQMSKCKVMTQTDKLVRPVLLESPKNEDDSFWFQHNAPRLFPLHHLVEDAAAAPYHNLPQERSLYWTRPGTTIPPTPEGVLDLVKRFLQSRQDNSQLDKCHRKISCPWLTGRGGLDVHFFSDVGPFN